MYRVEIDLRRCSGTSNCVEDAPEAYEIGPDGLARVRPGASDEDLRLGASVCPMDAILLFDATTGTKVKP